MTDDTVFWLVVGIGLIGLRTIAGQLGLALAIWLDNRRKGIR